MIPKPEPPAALRPLAQAKQKLEKRRPTLFDPKEPDQVEGKIQSRKMRRKNKKELQKLH